MSAKCVACGMPMQSAGEHAMGDPDKDYCVHCARPSGEMQSYEEKLESMLRFIMKSEGLDEECARETASRAMAELPAWRHRP